MFNFAKRLVDEIYEHAWGWVNLAICVVAVMFLVNEPEGWRRWLLWLLVVGSATAVMTRVGYRLAKKWRGDGYVPLYRFLVVALPILGFYPVVQAIISGLIFEEQPGIYIAIGVGAILGVARNAYRKPDGKNEKFAE